MLLAYHWPGNVRQLRNVVDSAVVLAEGDVIQPIDLGLREASPSTAGRGDDSLNGDSSLSIAHWEKKLIVRALEQTENKVVDAAKLLGIGRATLYRKIEEYDIAR